jgi:hypothetical protein
MFTLAAIPKKEEAAFDPPRGPSNIPVLGGYFN